MKKLNKNLIITLAVIILVNLMAPATVARAANTDPVSTSNDNSDLYPSLESLFSEMNFTEDDSLNAAFQNNYRRDIEDFVSGTWDGYSNSYMRDLYGVKSRRWLSKRSYHWVGYNSFTCESYNSVNINIDYIGSYRTVESYSFTVAIDDSTGIIEQWKLLELTDSWEIPIENKSIDKVIPLSHCSESEFQVIVTTVDEAGVVNMYTLYPDGKVNKLY